MESKIYGPGIIDVHAESRPTLGDPDVLGFDRNVVFLRRRHNCPTDSVNILLGRRSILDRLANRISELKPRKKRWYVLFCQEDYGHHKSNIEHPSGCQTEHRGAL